MAHISIQNLTVEFKIYGSSSRSLKRQILSQATGGLIKHGDRRQRRAVTQQRHRHLVVVIVLGGLARAGAGRPVRRLVHRPHRFGGGEHQPVQHAAAGRQHAGDPIGVVAVFMAIGT